MTKSMKSLMMGAALAGLSRLVDCFRPYFA